MCLLWVGRSLPFHLASIIFAALCDVFFFPSRNNKRARASGNHYVFFLTFFVAPQSLWQHISIPLREERSALFPQSWGRESMIKITKFFFFFCWTITENQREGRERWPTHSKNTKPHYHKVDFVLSTGAFLVSFFFFFFENTVLWCTILSNGLKLADMCCKAKTNLFMVLTGFDVLVFECIAQ